MKSVIYWLIIILLFWWAWLAACGPHYKPEYVPKSDVYSVFIEDKKACELFANKNTFPCLPWVGIRNSGWKRVYTGCMIEHGWTKTRVFDKGFYHRPGGVNHGRIKGAG